MHQGETGESQEAPSPASVYTQGGEQEPMPEVVFSLSYTHIHTHTGGGWHTYVLLKFGVLKKLSNIKLLCPL